MKKQILALGLISLLTACASEPKFQRNLSMEQVYDAVHNNAQRETVSLLREGLRSRPELGGNEPYYPIRYADVVAPVWVVPYANKQTGVKHGGRWDYIIVEEAQWAD